MESLLLICMLLQLGLIPAKPKFCPSHCTAHFNGIGDNLWVDSFRYLTKTCHLEIISNPIKVDSGRGRILDNQIKLVIQAGDYAHNVELWHSGVPGFLG